jgi:hypothetical protein
VLAHGTSVIAAGDNPDHRVIIVLYDPDMCNDNGGTFLLSGKCLVFFGRVRCWFTKMGYLYLYQNI